VKIDLLRVRFRYGDMDVIKGIDGEISDGVHALIGPNGSGKTTLLKCIAGILHYSGTILYDGKEMAAYSRKDQESLVSYLPQFVSSHVALTAFEVVLLGRLTSLKWRVGEKDHNLVRSVFNEFGIDHLQDRLINELSGGQRQMVFLAQAMIKAPRLLLLDEPTSSLDLQYQLELFHRISRYAEKNGISVVISLHDINMACRYARWIMVLHNGRIVSAGRPEDIIDCRLISDVYQVQAEIISDSRNNLHIIPFQIIKNLEGEKNHG